MLTFSKVFNYFVFIDPIVKIPIQKLVCKLFMTYIYVGNLN